MQHTRTCRNASASPEPSRLGGCRLPPPVHAPKMFEEGANVHENPGLRESVLGNHRLRRSDQQASSEIFCDHGKLSPLKIGPPSSQSAATKPTSIAQGIHSMFKLDASVGDEDESAHSGAAA
ncbi:uncharacterized protein PV07_01945 [Cladophialophora immunda]|uniref:Uncharacterized protein n=1 Tax=Cladophialophora immunda TaxID=569365 RepID=A0A0D2DHK6_9EURO|nr:uncharacterized protein PV07_01945 [Cladophialophora immunda]KIW35239.1 hypothetical protein PV07_01945 [Cladophialophora immunda]OQV03858.1 hypothetical protein CLAIMM_08845 [Cladophialophora immunda]